MADLKSQNKDNNFNLNALEFDIKKAIELSLGQESKSKNSSAQLTHFGENFDDGEDFEHTSTLDSSMPTTSKMSEKILNTHVIAHKMTTINYDTLFLNTRAEDIGILLCNMKNVLYDEESEQDKCLKICNFHIKAKK